MVKDCQDAGDTQVDENGQRMNGDVPQLLPPRRFLCRSTMATCIFVIVFAIVCTAPHELANPSRHYQGLLISLV